MPRIRQLAEKYAECNRIKAKEAFWKEIKMRRCDIDIDSMEALGREIGIDASTLRKNEAGDTKMSVTTIQKLVDFLKPDISTVLLFLGYSEKEIKAFARGCVNQ